MVVDDDGANGQAVAYIYYFDEDQGSSDGKLVCREEAEGIAQYITKLPTPDPGMTSETKLASEVAPET